MGRPQYRIWRGPPAVRSGAFVVVNGTSAIPNRAWAAGGTKLKNCTTEWDVRNTELGGGRRQYKVKLLEYRMERPLYRIGRGQPAVRSGQFVVPNGTSAVQIWVWAAHNQNKSVCVTDWEIRSAESQNEVERLKYRMGFQQYRIGREPQGIRSEGFVLQNGTSAIQNWTWARSNKK